MTAGSEIFSPCSVALLLAASEQAVVSKTAAINNAFTGNIVENFIYLSSQKRKSVFNNLNLAIYLHDKRMQFTIFVATASYDM
jgi:hypothetical protein